MTLESELNPNSRINWRLVVREHVIPALEWFEEKQRRTPPTLRTLFYRLYSLNVISNTENTYKRLSKVLVKERKDGNIPFDAIADESGRLVLCNFNDVYESPEKYIQRGINHIKNASTFYKVTRWYGQKHYVEVWIEKQALADTFESFLQGMDVRIIVNKGFASWTFLYENAQRLERVHQEHPDRDIHILYFGDFDPSGEDMDRYLGEALSYFELNHIVGFERIAVTEEQIREYDLPPTPEDSETLEKLDRDSRTNGFIEKHDGKLFAVELDAFLAIAPDAFRELVQESVDQYFDEDMYETQQAKHPPEEIERLVHQKVRFLEG
jgi:hypothetical protein